MDETIQAARRSLSDGHWHTGVFLGDMGAWQTKQGLFDEAESSLNEAHDILAGALGADHKRTLEVASRLVDLFQAVGKPSKAAVYRR